jgi:anti-sigma regulatory factor (Ser/Thr protein kinase)
MLPSVVVRIEERSHVGEVRRSAIQLAGDALFGEVDAARVALVVSEAATNVLNHAGRGVILLRLFEEEGCRVVEIVALDQGPGVKDTRVSMADGHSTAGTSGTGLGAIGRSVDVFDLYSRPDIGTVLLAQVRGAAGVAPSSSPLSRQLITGGVCVPKPSEQVSGDAWDALAVGTGMKVVVADGLGHGPQAAEASGEAIRAFRAHVDQPPRELLARMHAQLRPTRGAAVGVAEIDLEKGTLTFAGVGNIAAMIVSDGRTQRLVSHNGIVGHEMRKVHEFSYPWSNGSSIWLQSDGLSTHVDPARYPGVLQHHPSIAAALLFRDLSRGRDDSTAVVIHGWNAA